MSHKGGSTAAELWTQTPQAFFYEKVHDAQLRQKKKLNENVEHYVVNLLCEFVQSPQNQDDADCLALILKKALESPRGEQLLLFKRLGDTALYFSGFFQDYFNNKLFGIRYYMSMGENAYSQLADMMQKRHQLAQTYQDLSHAFCDAVDVLTDVSEQTQATSRQRDLLSLYSAWLDTASDKLENDIRKRGIIPIKVSKKWQ